MHDRDLVFYVLYGLDANWNSFISRIILKPDPISFDELYSHLLLCERIIEHQYFGSGLYKKMFQGLALFLLNLLMKAT